MFEYSQPVFRPPSEAYSFILQIMEGCSQNSCRFCGMYKTKPLKIYDLSYIKTIIEHIPDYYSSEIKRIFLGDGDALVLNKKDLKEVLNILNIKFPKLQRVSCYATANSILKYNSSELKELKSQKLKLFYMGLESGSQEVLTLCQKGNTVDQFIKACELLNEAQCKTSVTAILGLGGKKHTKKHAKETAKVVNIIKPVYFSLLTLIHGGNKEYIDSIELLSKNEIFLELFEIINNIEINTIFRSNHASNIININGSLQKDKQKMLDDLSMVINNTKDNPEYNKTPHFNGENSY